MVMDKHQVCLANTSFSPAVSMCAAQICILRPHPEDACISVYALYLCIRLESPKKNKSKGRSRQGCSPCHEITLIKFLNVSDGFPLLPMPKSDRHHF